MAARAARESSEGRERLRELLAQLPARTLLQELVSRGVTDLHRHPSDMLTGTATVECGGLPVGIIFSRPFTGQPVVLVSLASDFDAPDMVRAFAFTPTGFTAAVHKGHSGPSHLWQVSWLAIPA